MTMMTEEKEGVSKEDRVEEFSKKFNESQYSSMIQVKYRTLSRDC